MAMLYLQCAICGRKQAGGLLSAAAWGQAPLPLGAARDHPAVSDSSVRACPTCVEPGRRLGDERTRCRRAPDPSVLGSTGQ